MSRFLGKADPQIAAFGHPDAVESEIEDNQKQGDKTDFIDRYSGKLDDELVVSENEIAEFRRCFLDEKRFRFIRFDEIGRFPPDIPYGFGRCILMNDLFWKTFK